MNLFDTAHIAQRAARETRPAPLGLQLVVSLAVTLSAVCVSLALPMPASAQSSDYRPASTPGSATIGSARIAHTGVVEGAAEPTLYNRLKVGTLVEFDKGTSTVGEAMASLLTPVGYRVSQRTVDPALSSSVWNRPLPPATRDAGVMTIESAMLLLIGEENRLVVDHANRLVAVESLSIPLKPDTATPPTAVVQAPASTTTAAPTAASLAAPTSTRDEMLKPADSTVRKRTYERRQAC